MEKENNSDTQETAQDPGQAQNDNDGQIPERLFDKLADLRVPRDGFESQAIVRCHDIDDVTRISVEFSIDGQMSYVRTDDMPIEVRSVIDAYVSVKTSSRNDLKERTDRTLWECERRD